MAFTFGAANASGGDGSGNSANNAGGQPPAAGPVFGSTPGPGPAAAPSTTGTFSFAPAGGATTSSVPNFGAATPSGAPTNPGLPNFGAASSAPTAGAASSSGAPQAGGLFGASNDNKRGAPDASSAAPAFVAAPAPGTSNTTTTTTAAPASGPAFSGFGGASSTDLAPTAAPTPGTAFSFGGTPATTTSAPPPATSFNTAGGAPGPTPAQPPPQVTLTIPSFDATFENFGLWNKIRDLCAAVGKSPLAGQDLAFYVANHATSTLQIKPVQWTGPNMTLRQQLAQKPVVGLDENDLTKVDTVTRDTLEQVVLLASDLRISEAQAFSLYGQVSRDYELFHDLISGIEYVPMLDRSGMGHLQANMKYSAVTKLAGQVYFYERHLKMEAVLLLLQNRLKNDPDVIIATDSLLKEGRLIPNLMNLIRECTNRIQQLRQESVTSAGDTPREGRAPKSFAQVHSMFYEQERQIAAEGLVFLAYHTQLEMEEVTALIDLVRDMSGEIYKPSPFHAPDPYEIIDQSMSRPNDSLSWPSAHHFPFSSKEKDPLVWQQQFVREVVESGQIPLLKCVSLMLVAGVSAMDTKHILYNRHSHGPNDFGEGNLLLPPNQSSVESIRDLYIRFNHTSAQQWARKDVWGVLACCFALLLRSAPSVIASPAKGGASGQFPKEVREMSRFGIDIPLEVMSFSFCKLSVVPALDKMRSACLHGISDVSEFGLDILADFYSFYMDVVSDGALPNSRKRWENEEADELKLRKEEQDSQRQFEYWAGNEVHKSTGETIPPSVDLMARPECLDDLIALATTICSLGENYARKFWGTAEGGSLIPSRALQECSLAASEDESIVPSVLSWMAALSNSEDTANAVHALLNNDADAPSNALENLTKVINWQIMVHNLRWYAQELSPHGNSGSLPKQMPADKPSKASTAYYYNFSDTTSAEGGGAYSQSQGTSTLSSSKSSRRQQLSAPATLRVASYLSVIMSTSMHSAKARRHILSIRLPVSNGGVVTGEDNALIIFFNLALAPLAPHIRGATFTTIANLIQPTAKIADADVKEFLDDQAKIAWEYMDSCSVLPIFMLDRYFFSNLVDVASFNSTGLSFPPDSMTLASSSNGSTAMLSKDVKNSLLYEMEHIESRKGWYPSTEGFLQLLRSLVCAAGCPSKLGENWRPRPGCTPYLEYVINFVLPRALGSDGKSPLPFRMLGDQSRLVAKALGVVEAIITRYHVPSNTLKNGRDQAPAALLGVNAVAEKVCVSCEKSDARESAEDFKNLTKPFAHPAPAGSASSSGSSSTATHAGAKTHVPVPKSPGFTVLADLLSQSRGVLLHTLGLILTKAGGSKGIASEFGSQAEEISISYALYGSTPPSLESTKDARGGGRTKPLHTYLKPLLPVFGWCNFDETSFDDSVVWRETSVLLALNILCAAATREDSFIDAVEAVQTPPLKLVPVLQFETIKSGTSNFVPIDFRAVDVKATRLTDLLFSVSDSRLLRSAIADYIGYDASNESNDASISAAALCLFNRIRETLAQNSKFRQIFGDEAASKRFANAVSKRLGSSIKRSNESIEIQSLSLILNWMLSELRQGLVVTDGLAQVLLGLPSAVQDGNWNSKRSYHRGSVGDCFDAILEILMQEDILLQSDFAQAASYCYEVFFRLYDQIKLKDAASMKIAIYTAERLRKVSFWEKSVQKLSFWIASAESQYDSHIIHATAWLLKGLSLELKLLVGFANEDIRETSFAHFLEPRPFLCSSLLSTLYGSDQAVLKQLIDALSLESASADPSLPSPPREALGPSSYDLPGPRDVMQGYQLVDSEKAISAIATMGPEIDVTGMGKWLDHWNSVVSKNCAIDHVADAISTIVEASLYNALSMRGRRSDLFQSSGYDHPWLHIGGAQDLLYSLLHKLDKSSIASEFQGMDDVLIPAATKNLSKGILFLAEFMTVALKDGSANSGDLVRLGAIVARAVHFSCIGEDAADEAFMRYERSTTLASALAQLLQRSASMEVSFIMQHLDDFVAAVHGLARLSCFPQGSDPRGVVSILSRSSMSAIITAISDEVASDFDDSFVCSCLTRSFMESLFSLVMDLDEDVCNLFAAVAMQPFGAEVLISGGICGALKSAAVKYVKLEESTLSDPDHEFSFDRSSIRAPKFMLGHLKLMCSMLTVLHDPRDHHSEFHRDELAVECIKILAMYRKSFQRLFEDFPVQLDYLRWGLRCLVLACSILQSFQGSASEKEDFRTSFTNAGFLSGRTVTLLKHLVENPLPIENLPAEYPGDFQESLKSSDLGTVRVENVSQGSWWERISYHQTSFVFNAPIGAGFTAQSAFANSWTEDTFEYSIVAAEICSLGLELLKRMDVPIDTSALGRGLYRSLFAAGAVGARRSELQNRSNFMQTNENGNAGLEYQYVTMLGAILSQSVEEALTLSLSLSHVKENVSLDPVISAINSSAGALAFLPRENQEIISLLVKEIQSRK